MNKTFYILITWWFFFYFPDGNFSTYWKQNLFIKKGWINLGVKSKFSTLNSTVGKISPSWKRFNQNNLVRINKGSMRVENKSKNCRRPSHSWKKKKAKPWALVNTYLDQPASRKWGRESQNTWTVAQLANIFSTRIAVNMGRTFWYALQTAPTKQRTYAVKSPTVEMKVLNRC